MRAFRNNVRAKLGAPPLEGGDPKAGQPASAPADNDDASSVTSADDEVQEETSAQKLLRAARNKFIERRLVGTISLSRMRGIVSHSLSCEVTDEDLPEEDDDDLGDLGRMDRKMISMFDALLNQLEKSAKAWEGHPYADKVTLMRSSELGFYLPVLISVGFRIEIALEANVASLIRSRLLRKRQKSFKDALKTVDQTMVEGVMLQGGFPLFMAQKAVIATQNSGIEEALTWAINKSPDEIEAFRKDFGGEKVADSAAKGSTCA